ncbi:hypothetical protein EPUL_005687, partial [Erysiphe pulchra]
MTDKPEPILSTEAIPDEPTSPTLAITLASSSHLTHLPIDVTNALSTIGEFPKKKVTVYFTPVGSAPTLRQNVRSRELRTVFKNTSTQRFEVVVSYLRRTLRITENESIFVYVNSSFAPALDEVVGNLHRYPLRERP